MIYIMLAKENCQKNNNFIISYYIISNIMSHYYDYPFYNDMNWDFKPNVTGEGFIGGENRPEGLQKYWDCIKKQQKKGLNFQKAKLECTPEKRVERKQKRQLVKEEKKKSDELFARIEEMRRKNKEDKEPSVLDKIIANKKEAEKNQSVINEIIENKQIEKEVDKQLDKELDKLEVKEEKKDELHALVDLKCGLLKNELETYKILYDKCNKDVDIINKNIASYLESKNFLGKGFYMPNKYQNPHLEILTEEIVKQIKGGIIKENSLPNLLPPLLRNLGLKFKNERYIN